MLELLVLVRFGNRDEGRPVGWKNQGHPGGVCARGDKTAPAGHV